MHQTSRLIEVAEKLEGMEDASGLILPDEEAQELKIEGNGIIDYDDDDIQDILHQLKHEVEALAMLREIGILLKEPIQGRCSFPGWPEIGVIGPTYEYYKSLFPEYFDLSRFVELEMSELKAAKDEPVGKDAFESLDRLERADLTPTNLNSAIIQIAAEQGKFLFTGDAGIESLKEIPDFSEKIKDVHFLKVPHHGSANNLDSELIQLLNPQIAFVSGGSHVSNKVVEALRQLGATVLITRDAAESLVYPIQKK